ncbi:MAG TPA: hypothetical protein VKB11_05125 [Acidimicrobiia bacterium]|nr:hypothetical protein [Acidimicrobiia bacterium]
MKRAEPGWLLLSLAGLAAVIGSFLPFYTFARGVDATVWSRGLFPTATLIPLLGFLIGAEALFVLLRGHELRSPLLNFTWEQVRLGAGAFMILLALSYLLQDRAGGSLGAGYIVLSLSALATFAGGVMTRRVQLARAPGEKPPVRGPRPRLRPALASVSRLGSEVGKNVSDLGHNVKGRLAARKEAKARARAAAAAAAAAAAKTRSAAKAEAAPEPKAETAPAVEAPPMQPPPPTETFDVPPSELPAAAEKSGVPPTEPSAAVDAPAEQPPAEQPPAEEPAVEESDPSAGEPVAEEPEATAAEPAADEGEAPTQELVVEEADTPTKEVETPPEQPVAEENVKAEPADEPGPTADLSALSSEPVPDETAPPDGVTADTTVESMPTSPAPSPSASTDEKAEPAGKDEGEAQQEEEAEEKTAKERADSSRES